MPFGIVAAGASLALPVPALDFLKAPIAGIACSWCVLFIVTRLFPARALWSDLDRTASVLDIERFRTAERAVRRRKLTWAVGLALTLAHVVAIAVALREDLAMCAAWGRQSDRQETKGSWGNLRRCLAERGGQRYDGRLHAPDEIARIFAGGYEGTVWRSLTRDCDAEAGLLYAELKRYQSGESMARALESIAHCNTICSVPSLELGQALLLRDAGVSLVEELDSADRAERTK